MELDKAFLSIIDDIDDGIVICDAAGIIRRTNARAKTLLNLPENKNGTNFFRHIETNFSSSRTLGGILEQIDTNGLPLEICRAETETFNPLFLSLKIYKTGQDNSLFVYLKDDTDRHLQTLLESDFLTMISHKLRTPIVALCYAMNLVLKRKDLQFSENEADDFIQQSYYKSFEISEVVEKLIRFASVIKDITYSRNETCDPAEILEETLDKYRRKFKKIRPPFDVEVINKTGGQKVLMASEYLSVVLECLIDNAVKFSSGKDIKITVTLGPVKDGVIMAGIADNGPGIPGEFHEKIFESFFQIDKYCTGTVEGVGLGLPLVRHILKAYKQTIKVESSLNHGAVFSFTLPLALDGKAGQ